MPELRIGSWHDRDHGHGRETDELRASEATHRERLARQTALAEHLRFHSEGLQRALQKRPPSRRRLAATLREVAKVSSLALEAHHTSIWVFDAQTQTLHCSMLLVGQVEQTERAVVPLGLDCTRYPKYLMALTESRTLAVNDVHADETTFELAATLRRRNIGALLDIPVRIPGALLGVICHAHVGGPRTWEREEIEFAAQAGSLLGIALATEQRVQTEHAARSYQYEYRHLVETVPMIAYAFDVRTGKLDCMSPRSFALGGWPAEQWLSGGRDHWLARVHPSDRAGVQARFDPRAALPSPGASSAPHKLTYRVILPDGQVRWVNDTCSRVRKRAGDRITLQGTLRDVTTQMETELERRELERRHRFMCDHADLHAVMLDQDARVTYVNDYFCRTTGFTRQQIIGRNWFEFTAPPEARARVQAEYNEGLTRGWLSPRMEGPLRTASQARRHVLWTTTLLRRTDGAVEGVSGLGVDLTQRLQLEAALQRQTGFDALGRMSAGAVHDLNNLLTVMVQETSRLGAFVDQRSDETTPNKHDESDLSDSTGTERQRARASHSALRAALSQAAELTHSLLEHGRDEALRTESVVLDDLMQESLHLASLIAGPALRVTASFHSGSSTVQIDRAQLRQVLLNLVGNAADATRGVGRQIELSTHREYVSKAHKQRADGVRTPDDDRAVITVSDDGSGIDAETLGRIFEPFFTTKGPGRGTGLGLAMCKSIVENAGGHIAVDSTLGKGAQFRVYLPIATPHATTSTALAPLPEVSGHAVHPPARLLVVDDVAGIRCLIADCLREAGHVVFEAADVAAARQHLATQQLDMLISDASLPDGSGIALARSARSARPELKVVMISGKPTARGNFDAVLLKPFDLDELIKLVGSLLDAPAAVAG